MEFKKWLVQFDEDRKVTDKSDTRVITNVVHLKNFLKKHFGNEEEVLEAQEDGHLVINECEEIKFTYTTNPVLHIGEVQIGEL